MRMRRHRRLARLGLCPSRGYDLRAGSEGYRECEAAATPAKCRYRSDTLFAAFTLVRRKAADSDCPPARLERVCEDRGNTLNFQLL